MRRPYILQNKKQRYEEGRGAIRMLEEIEGRARGDLGRAGEHYVGVIEMYIEEVREGKNPRPIIRQAIRGFEQLVELIEKVRPARQTA
ncbi:hypothetical protein COU61_01910 [Candidatus Pacearchaeota archaeon CG10_big_fil_rev_8_21_14_0_10_35_13]|nr:MAG: hypothetical protein COU61_01910 [Candidatus Pacearchaeota archaeon CG10_big_fil_rev_8_21_14_0_10_35_13]